MGVSKTNLTGLKPRYKVSFQRSSSVGQSVICLSRAMVARLKADIINYEAKPSKNQLEPRPTTGDSQWDIYSNDLKLFEATRRNVSFMPMFPQFIRCYLDFFVKIMKKP